MYVRMLWMKGLGLRHIGYIFYGYQVYFFHLHCGFPKIRGTVLRLPMIRITAFAGPYRGPLFLEAPV